MDAEWSLKEMKQLSKQVEEDPKKYSFIVEWGVWCANEKNWRLVYVCIIKKKYKLPGFAAMHIIEGIYDNNEAAYASGYYR